MKIHLSPSRAGNTKVVVIVVVVLVVIVGVLLACGGVLLALLLPAVQSAREMTLRAVAENNLRQIGSSLMMHDVQKGALPPPYIADDNGRPMHSWRVLLLPYLDRQDLYEMYNFDEPWDSEHNRQLIPLMPDVYAARPGETSSGKTNFLAIVGPDTAFDPSRQNSLAMALRGDGSSMTVGVVEAVGAEVIWTEPRDVDFATLRLSAGGAAANKAAGQPVNENIGSVLLLDGHTEFIGPRVDPDVLRAITTVSGGELVDVYSLSP